MQTLAVIPARGGSRRIPRKNIRELAGRPMIAWTIQAARTCGLFDRVVVSTDNPEIVALARSLGACVPFLREPALADDFTPVSLVTLDTVERLAAAGEAYVRVAQLMPTCPLRTAEDIRASEAQFAANPAQPQISVVRYGWQNPWWAMRLENTFTLAPLFPENLRSRSQDLAELYCPTGAIWWATTEALRQERTFHAPRRSGWEIPWQRGIDIDTMDDWQMTELLLTTSRRPEVPA